MRLVYESLPARVVFGDGSIADLPAEVERLQIHHALIVCTPARRAWAEEIEGSLAGRSAGICDRAVMHVPAEIAADAAETARLTGADGLIALGGGSPIGLAKAVAVETSLPIIAVPTTYSGSEMTPIWGITEGERKRTARDLRALPRTVVYDPEVTVSLPPSVSGPSGMNAIAHCVEALYAETANPITSLLAEDAIERLARSLPSIVDQPSDRAARSDALMGAWLAGTTLASVDVALHHKLCHTLGGAFGLPHAEVHTVILPHAAAYNSSAAPDAMRRVARALGAEDAPAGLYDLAVRLGAPVALEQIGMRETDLERAAEMACQNPYHNPRPVTVEGVRALLEDAFRGRRPVGAHPVPSPGTRD